MLNSSDQTQLNQHHTHRINEEEHTLMMTIEYLRARLLSERSISKVAKERSDDLVKRVKELEEQLKVVTFQRKRAEKAALDVISYLDSLGISDNLEVYECDSDEDESACESSMDNSDTAKNDKTFESSENKGNDKESSGSEHESNTPSSSRSLSWKGRKESTRLLDVKLLSSSLRSRSGIAQLYSLPRHRLGKSCRQNRRRELRSTYVKLMHDSCKSNAQDGNCKEGPNHCQDCSDSQNGKVKRSPERGYKNDEGSHSSQTRAQECDVGCSTRELECSGEMERALQHQAHLIRSYEAQEKAQRDWEEKYRDNNDSCEPGSHSDITEERDDNKAVAPHPVEVDASPSHDGKTGMETNVPGEKRSMAQFNSFKISSDAKLGSSGEHKFSENPSTSADFAFFVPDNNKLLENVGQSDSSHGGSTFYQSRPPQNINRTRTLVPHKEPAKLGSVLDALQEAKQVIKQHMDTSPKTRESVGKAIEVADPINRDIDWLKLPVRCPGLFRVPIDFDGQASNQSSFLSLNYPSEPSTSTHIPRTAGHLYVSKPMDPSFDIASGPLVRTPVLKSELEISERQPRSDFFAHRSPNQMQSQFQGNETRKSSFGYPSFENFEFHPNAYK